MADYISRRTVETVLEEVTRLVYQNPTALTDQLEAEQPVLLDYLYELDQLPFGMEEEITFTEDEAGHILYVGVVLWQALNQSRGPLRPLTWNDIDAATTEVEQSFVNLIGQDRAEIPGAALLMIENHPEPELLRFVVEAIHAWPGDQPGIQPIRPEYRSVVQVLFQIVMTALFRALPAESAE